MRKQCSLVLKKYFHNYLIKTRSSMELTQAQMAQRLEMDERSYVELDHGKSCCSALTLVLFLLYCCDDPALFLAGLRAEIEREFSNAA